MEHFDVIVVGGGPAGFNAVKAVRSLYPEKRVLVLNDREDLQIPCSIPYVVAGLLKPEDNRYPVKKLAELGATLLFERVVSVNPQESRIFTESGKLYSYDRLVLATGWLPRRLPVEGTDLEGVYYIDNSTEAVINLVKEVASAKRIAIVGGGFISIGFADLISRFLRKEITVIEASHRIGSGVFSGDFESEMTSLLESAGVRVLKGAKVTALEGSGRVEAVLLEGGERIETDLVLIFIGFLPNSKLAVDASLKVDRGFVVVDRFLRSSVDNILAAGNVALHYSAVDGAPWPGMVASVSARDGRIAGANTAGPVVEDRGIVPAGVTEVGGRFFGFAGYTQELLSGKGFDFKKCGVTSADAYPKAIGAKPLKLDLYFLKGSGRLVGAEVEASSRYVAPLVDLVAGLVERGITAYELLSKVSVAFPPVTPPPLLQPLQEAALAFLRS